VEKEKTNVTESRSLMVVKANDIIQKARFQLSTQEQKIIIYLISKLKPGDKEFQPYQFDLKEFCKVCGIDSDNGKNYINLKSTIKSLADKSLWVTVGDHEILFRWINDVDITKKSGIIVIQFHERMKPFLLELKNNYTQYEMLYILAMKSQYAIRLYELLKSQAFKKKPVTYDIDELKRLLMAESYVKLSDLKSRVIDRAAAEINNLSDIFISYEFIKQGRSYTQIKFRIQAKTELDDRLETIKQIHEAIGEEIPGMLKTLTPNN
jgi:plasmid replication initiation protein